MALGPLHVPVVAGVCAADQEPQPVVLDAYGLPGADRPSLPANHDLRLGVGAQVRTPAGQAAAASVGGHQDERVAVWIGPDRGLARLAGARPGGGQHDGQVPQRTAEQAGPSEAAVERGMEAAHPAGGAHCADQSVPRVSTHESSLARGCPSNGGRAVQLAADDGDPVNCPACGTANEPGRKFCGECGTRLSAACPACGTSNAPGTKFCGECGTALTDAPPALAAEPGQATPITIGTERRLVTVLFGDLVGSTTLAEDRDPEETRTS